MIIAIVICVATTLKVSNFWCHCQQVFACCESWSLNLFELIQFFMVTKRRNEERVWSFSEVRFETRHIKMRLVILDTADKVAEWSAKYVLKRINDFKPGPDKYFVLGLPTGGTPLGMYKKLIEFHIAGKISFKYVKTFNMDEYVGLPRNHPESYHYYMWNNFFKHIDIDPTNAHILDGNAADLQKECEEFEKKITEAGGVELFIGGIGPDGHIAFNEPGSSLVSRTRVKTLAQDTLEANARFFGNDISKVPKQALTVGVGTVMDAKEVMILITGAHKAFALYKAIEEGVNHMWTVSAFQQHRHTLFICDEDATLELRVKTVKYFKNLWSVHSKLVDAPWTDYGDK